MNCPESKSPADTIRPADDNVLLKSERPQEAIVKKKRLDYRLNRFCAKILNAVCRKPLPYQALGPRESLTMLLETGKSYIRIGNGESEILVGLDMATQEYNGKLKADILEIISGYSPGSRYLLGLTNYRLKQGVAELKATPNQNAFNIWKFMRYVFWRYRMDRISMPFLEAAMFRVGEGLQFEEIEALWKSAGHIIVLHNNEKYFAWFRSLYPDKHLHFVQIPDKNFFFYLKEYQDRILRLIGEQRIDHDDLVILVAAGPGAKVLCYNLCQKEGHYRCYDIGNFFHMHYHLGSQK